jgi:hypothetical protein
MPNKVGFVPHQRKGNFDAVCRVPSSSRQGSVWPHPRRYGGSSRIPKPIRGGGMNTRVAPLGLLGLSLLAAGVAAARAQAPETVFALRHGQRAPTRQIA